MAFTTARTRRADSLAPVGRLRLPRRPTLVRLAAVAALLLTAAAVLYAGETGSRAEPGNAAPATSSHREPAPAPPVPRSGSGTPDSGTPDSGTPDSGAARGPGLPPPDSPDRTGRLPVPPGLVGVPVRLADPTSLALLRPGDRVDLLSIETAAPALAGQPPEPEPVPVAAAALVLAADRTAAALLVAVTRAESRTVLAAAAHATLVVLVRPDG